MSQILVLQLPATVSSLVRSTKVPNPPKTSGLREKKKEEEYVNLAFSLPQLLLLCVVLCCVGFSENSKTQLSRDESVAQELSKQPQLHVDPGRFGAKTYGC